MDRLQFEARRGIASAMQGRTRTVHQITLGYFSVQRTKFVLVCLLMAKPCEVDSCILPDWEDVKTKTTSTRMSKRPAPKSVADGVSSID